VDFKFNDDTHMLANFDGKGGWSWGGPNASVVNQADGSIPPYASKGKYVSIKGAPGASQYWWGNAVLNAGNWPTTIPDNTPVSKLVLKFNLYAGKPWNVGHFAFTFVGKEISEWKLYQEREIPTDKWITVSVPVSKFPGLTTYADIKAVSQYNSIGLFFKNWTTTVITEFDLSFDDFRLEVLE
jgi:hypothetical protein